jgi:hypothetical protein
LRARWKVPALSVERIDVGVFRGRHGVAQHIFGLSKNGTIACRAQGRPRRAF